MIHFKNIKLQNYRNFINKEIQFNKNCNVLYGKNGTGKTNILESISLFGKGRGLRNDRIKNMVHIEKNNFNNYAELELNQNLYNLEIISEEKNNKQNKKILINNNNSVESKKFLDSSLSFIYFLPEMERLFVSSPSNRRNFIDKLIFTKEKSYNQIINNYKKNILERNKILNSEYLDNEWLNNIENNIASLAIKIYNFRNSQIQTILSQIKKIEIIIKKKFDIKIELRDKYYKPDLNLGIILDDLKNARQHDKLYGGIKFGPQRSDFYFYTGNQFPVDQLSTGQQKTVILLILFSQIHYLVNERNLYPIALFDEICSHLDEFNRSILQHLTNEFNIQFFMTGTSKTLFSFLSTNTNFYNITEV